jgi:hypothetical protein
MTLILITNHKLSIKINNLFRFSNNNLNNSITADISVNMSNTPFMQKDNINNNLKNIKNSGERPESSKTFNNIFNNLNNFNKTEYQLHKSFVEDQISRNETDLIEYRKLIKRNKIVRLQINIG